MAQSFIGKPISLISHSDVRYRGILAGIDPAASTIQLSNVYSMGTETRRPASGYIPPMAEPYQYIIFKASEVKDLAVDEPVVVTRNVHDDPAVMASAPIAPAPPAAYAQQTNVPPGQPQQQYAPRPPQPQQQPSAPAPAPSQQNVTTTTQASDNAAAAQAQAGANGSRSGSAAQNRRPNPVHTASASLETVERALGDLRVSNNNAQVQQQAHRGGRRNNHVAAPAQAPIAVPKTDFDFASSNAKFDKSAVAANASPGLINAVSDSGSESSGAEEGEEKEKKDVKEKGPVAYNPQKSFFDTLSSNAAPDNTQRGGNGGAPGGGYGAGRGRGRGGRSRRDEEREKNVATFGEPGGVGLMGPGAYVGGWGGYGRRGGRPRRGGGRGGSNQNQPVQARG